MGSDSILSKMESDPISVSALRRRCLLAIAAGIALGARAQPPARSAAHAGPALWRVRAPAGAAGSGWLFGSVHAGLDAAEPLPSLVDQAWARADVLAIEIDVVARWAQLRELYAAAALLPGEDTIEALLGPDRAGRIRAYFGFDDARWAGLRRLAPWALLAILDGEDPRHERRTTRHGIEARFLESARRRALPIVELEQAGEQVAALAGASLEAQAAWLWRRFESMARDEGLGAAIVAAWRAGDEARLAALKTRAWGEAGDPAAPRARMFGERDQRIARRLADLLERPHTVFTLVGAFHLAGDDALPGILADHGVRTERIPNVRDDKQR